MSGIIINIVHILIFAPLLLLLVNNPQWNNNVVRVILAIMGLGVMFYHGQKALATQHWVYIFHTVVVAGLLLTLAWQGQNISSQTSQITTLLAISAIAYHSWRAYGKLQ